MTVKRLIGQGPSQISRNKDLGSLAFMDADGVNIKGGNVDNVDSLSLDSIKQRLGVDATSVFVYDTSKDSDGGAWRKRCKHTSWYNETLNTSVRGSRKEFPSVAVLVTTSSGLVIYDGDDSQLPMWMTASVGGSFQQYWLGGSGTTPKAVCAANGTIVVGKTAWGLHYVNFISEEITFRELGYYRTLVGGIVNRNGGLKDSVGDLGTAGWLYHDSVNDVDITILPGAPIDPATGLPRPTIAAAVGDGASAGGVSVIKHDNTVIHFTSTSGGAYHYSNAVSFDAQGRLWSSKNTNGTSRLTCWCTTKSINEYSGITSIPVVTGSDTTIINFTPTSHNNETTDSVRLSVFAQDQTTFSIAERAIADTTYPAGVNFVQVGAEGGDMVAYVTSKYNTGWMPQSVKGAWLCDTKQSSSWPGTNPGDISSEYLGNTLITNGTFVSDISGWTWNHYQNKTTAAWESGYAKVTNIGGVAGADTAWLASQAFTVVPNSRYLISFKIRSNKTGQPLDSGTNGFGSRVELGGTITAFPDVSVTNDLWVTRKFIASSGTSTSGLFVIGGDWSQLDPGEYVMFDDVSVQLISDTDRSCVYYNTNAQLAITGSGQLTKSPVDTGADLVAYSGFTSSTYLYKKSGTGADINWQGDWTFISWSPNSQHTWCVWNEANASQAAYDAVVTSIYCDGSTHYLRAGGTAGVDLVLNVKMFAYVYSKGLLKIYADGKLLSNVAYTPISATGSILVGVRRGYNAMTAGPVGAKMCLVRVAQTAISPEQVKKIYNDEINLFNKNAKCVLGGSNDVVRAVAFDKSTGLYHIGTPNGRSVFSNLLRTDYSNQTPVWTSISVSNGFVAEQ